MKEEEHKFEKNDCTVLFLTVGHLHPRDLAEGVKVNPQPRMSSGGEGTRTPQVESIPSGCCSVGDSSHNSLKD
jgi:hypothetical protein